MEKVKIENGYKEYIKYKERIDILEDINVSFEANKIYMIVGNSGAGKTTLLNIIGTLDSLTKGNLYIDGAYSKEVFQRYLNISDNLTVVFRKDRKIYDENYAKKNFEQFDSKKIKYVEYLDKNT